ncbi:GNAT family N-acetyltransferase [Sphingomonas nostoxanthinifaciens]|uniref:GNAT family N-acetyltransferase n=1 Tax=Sphingomonas nostoxanthinifaciens TaxID=2872652 RepID=UPI001CC21AC7|nr:GNAT family N-acetyltransferase [Sphingomonas nostoxanthinifaciens]UAK23084.1 GNAT family N-acetyltransferase [Sphingomonas nostoxanthinifaciens]
MTELFRHVSPEDRRFRFFGTIQQIGDEQITPMLAVDDGTITFIAFSKEAPIACCTLIDDLDGKSADVGLSIRSDWKGVGVSWTLLEHVLQYAAAHGLTTVTSLESGNDRIAIALEREMGFVARLSSASPIEMVLSKRVD